MTVKEAMSRLKNSFAYERFQGAISQDPQDVRGLTEAYNALCHKELEILKPVLKSFCESCISPELHFASEEEVRRYQAEKNPFQKIWAAADHWRKELMPDYHEFLEKVLKQKQEGRASQAQA